jgi:hypothetical protein
MPRAHQCYPHSNATRGNIVVDLTDERQLVPQTDGDDR